MNEFYKTSGIIVNDKKTRHMWIGTNSNELNPICTEIDLGWKTGPAEYLCVFLIPCESSIAELNYDRKIAALRSKLAFWGSKGLTRYTSCESASTEN